MKSTDIKTVSDDFKLETSQDSYGLLTPGFSDERLNTASQTRGGSGGLYYSAYVQRLGTAGTGAWSYTGVGFKPKMIMVKGIFASGTGATSDGFATDGNAGDCVYQYGTTVSYVATRVLYVTDNTGTVRQAASLTSMDSDGFTLNFTTSAANADYIFTCYG